MQRAPLSHPTCSLSWILTIIARRDVRFLNDCITDYYKIFNRLNPVAKSTHLYCVYDRYVFSERPVAVKLTSRMYDLDLRY